MKLFVLSSCSKIMASRQEQSLTCEDLNALEKIDYHLKTASQKKRARELFRGPLNISVNVAVDQLRKYFDVKYSFLTTLGLLDENDEIPPYNCFFSDMTEEEIRAHAESLNIPKQFKTLIESEQPEFIYLAVRPQHLCALGSEWEDVLSCPTIAYLPSRAKFVISLPEDHLPKEESIRISGLPFRSSLSYRDDLLLLTKRFLVNSTNPEQSLKEILTKPQEILYLLSSIRKHALS